MKEDDSKCRKNILCDFEVSRDLPDAQVEICIRCNKKVIYKKDKRGRIDNKKYLRDHIRHTIQPWGKTRKLFLQIYGEKWLREVESKLKGKKSKEEIQREWDSMRREIVKRERIYI